jgi:hypothetical protein
MIIPKSKFRKMRSFADFGFYGLLLLLSLLLLSVVTSCQKAELAPVNSCGTLATIRDLRGLDGCGFILELDNGEKLEPVYDYGFCGTPPLPTPVINDIQFLDGKRVSIAYKELKDRSSICMVGKVVEITCISEVSAAKED